MTELQMGLIGLGAAAIAGVFAYNNWQERRHRKLAESLLKPKHDDVLLAGSAPVTSGPALASERSEPEIRADAASDSRLERVEPVLVNAQDDGAERAMENFPLPEAASIEAPGVITAEETDSALPASLLDPRIEFIVAMELVDPVAVAQILHSQRDVLQKLSKAVYWVGFNDSTREWSRLQADDDFAVRRLRVGLQLADRRGPVSDGDLVIFAGAMQALADELMAVADMPSIRVREQATEIDRFSAEVDLEIGVNLISKGAPFSGTKIRALAEAAGLVLGTDGLFTRYDDDAHAVFCLQNFENVPFSLETIRSMSTNGLTFLLDVPRVDHGERVFGQMVDLAKRFGDTLQGTLVDDNRQPLSDAQLDHIRREFIGKPQDKMAAYALPAGSPQALRLFS